MNKKRVISISLKLMVIITLLVLSSLSTMIFFASFLFKDDVEIRIVENNHSRSSIIASRIETDFSAVVKTASIVASALATDIGEEEKEHITKMVFQNERDVVYIALASKNDSTLKIDRSLANTELIEQLGTTSSKIENAIFSETDNFLQSFNFDQVVRNVSQLADIPLIAISIPWTQNNSDSNKAILIVCINPASICEAVKTEGITKTLVVNRDGDVLAHEDSAMVLSRANISKLPLISAMQTSKIDNGQLKYRDEGSVQYLGSFKKIPFGSIGVASYAESEKAFQSVSIIQRRNTLILIIVLNAALIVGFLFSKTITSPIKRLVKSMKEVEKGNFGYQISPIPADELGLLMDSFNKMNRGLQERETIKSAFGRFVNKDLAERALKEEINLGGERKKVSVFFSDIRSFTSISERLEPEEVVSFLNEYMTLMVECVNSCEGTVDKFIGDAIMSVWGIPLTKDTDAINAVDAAIKMRKTLIKYNKNRGTTKKPKIHIGCGINTGYVLAGQIGSQEKMDYTVIGDTVNFASRIEQLNKPFGTDILISEETYSMVKDEFSCIKMQKIFVKGKQKAQQIWAVLGRIDDNNAPKTLQELRKLLGIQYNPSQKHSFDEKKYSATSKQKQEIL